MEAVARGLRSLGVLPRVPTSELPKLLANVLNTCGEKAARRALRAALISEMQNSPGGVGVTLADAVARCAGEAPPAVGGRPTSLDEVPEVLLSHACSYVAPRDVARFARVCRQTALVACRASSFPRVRIALRRPHVQWSRVACHRPSRMRVDGTLPHQHADAFMPRVWGKVEHLVLHNMTALHLAQLRRQTELRTLWIVPLSTSAQVERLAGYLGHLRDLRVGTVDVRGTCRGAWWSAATQLEHVQCNDVQGDAGGVASFDGWPRVQSIIVGSHGGRVHGGVVLRALEACVDPGSLHLTLGTTPVPSPAAQEAAIPGVHMLAFGEEYGAHSHNWLKVFAAVYSVDAAGFAEPGGPSLPEFLRDVAVREARHVTVERLTPLRVRKPTDDEQAALDLAAHSVLTVVVESSAFHVWTPMGARHLCDALVVAGHAYLKLRVSAATVGSVWRAVRDNLGGFRLTRLRASSSTWLVVEADWEP